MLHYNYLVLRVRVCVCLFVVSRITSFVFAHLFSSSLAVPLEQLNGIVPLETKPAPEYPRQHALRASRIDQHGAWLAFFL